MSEIPDLEAIRRNVHTGGSLGWGTPVDVATDVDTLLSYVGQLQEALGITLEALLPLEEGSLGEKVHKRLAALLPDEANPKP